MPHITRTLPGGHEAAYVWFAAMHTRIDILLKSDVMNGEELLGVASEMRELIAEIEAVGNRFDASSELYAFNLAEAGVPVPVSGRLYEMLSLCQEYNILTQGLFDVTVGSVGHNADTPRKLHAAPGRSFVKEVAGLTVDLSGFLKGYALDALRGLLCDRGVDNALVSMGNSSIMAMGDVPGPVTDGCLTTSGNDSEQRRHIMNPLTGGYVTGKRRVEVASRGGAEGEVLSTALFLSEGDGGVEKALRDKFEVRSVVWRD